MSGGSYDYLYAKDAEDLFVREHTLREMSDRLAGLGYARDAARETETVLLILRQVANRLDTSIDRLRDIWHAVEWWDSGDSGESRLLVALARYRGEPLPRCALCGCEIVREPSPPPLYQATGYSHVDHRAALDAGCAGDTATPPAERGAAGAAP